MTKAFLIPAILGLAGFLVAAEAAQAQVRVIIGGGGRGPGYYPGGGFYPRGGYYPYSRPYYPPYVAPVVVRPIVVREAYSPPVIVDSSSSIPAVPAAPVSNVANIRVLLPDPQAKVWFDGNLTRQGGTDRLFHTPPLAAGNYNYRIRASWIQDGKEMIQEAVANVAAGQTSTVDFSRPLSEGIPTPK